ncbi:hypothetical protein RchiOBHm_Chr7g0211931 [Rosa chinensis]|uniref:Uncharacterized protein n=1 Tax=Rosa chinensis TaxID=74649 RepID=A0A2P6PAK5_ROSCH|nr:hypothetical protein RchiOBHm_Chr7g0211931 [Rosa chinensis]
MIALASTTATAMPLEDLQLSTNTLPAAIEESEEFWGFGSGCFFTMLLQQETAFGFGSGIGAGVTVASRRSFGALGPVASSQCCSNRRQLGRRSGSGRGLGMG